MSVYTTQLVSSAQLSTKTRKINLGLSIENNTLKSKAHKLIVLSCLLNLPPKNKQKNMNMLWLYDEFFHSISTVRLSGNTQRP